MSTVATDQRPPRVHASSEPRFYLRSEDRQYLHFSCRQLTPYRAWAWIGSERQASKAQAEYSHAAQCRLQPVEG